MSRVVKQARQRNLQLHSGMNRTEARRAAFGQTWKTSTQYGRGIQRAITKAEKERREALRAGEGSQELGAV
jgi:hypothetical protein